MDIIKGLRESLKIIESNGVGDSIKKLSEMINSQLISISSQDEYEMTPNLLCAILDGADLLSERRYKNLKLKVESFLSDRDLFLGQAFKYYRDCFAVTQDEMVKRVNDAYGFVSVSRQQLDRVDKGSISSLKLYNYLQKSLFFNDSNSDREIFRRGIIVGEAFARADMKTKLGKDDQLDNCSLNFAYLCDLDTKDDVIHYLSKQADRLSKIDCDLVKSALEFVNFNCSSQVDVYFKSPNNNDEELIDLSQFTISCNNTAAFICHLITAYANLNVKSYNNRITYIDLVDDNMDILFKVMGYEKTSKVYLNWIDTKNQIRVAISEIGLDYRNKDYFTKVQETTILRKVRKDALVSRFLNNLNHYVELLNFVLEIFPIDYFHGILPKEVSAQIFPNDIMDTESNDSLEEDESQIQLLKCFIRILRKNNIFLFYALARSSFYFVNQKVTEDINSRFEEKDFFEDIGGDKIKTKIESMLDMHKKTYQRYINEHNWENYSKLIELQIKLYDLFRSLRKSESILLKELDDTLLSL